ncbi:hypothetical protein DX926_10065 [Bacillus atrophaeus]|nr:hypothetical protein DX926_10065 [Bacillus atrophaeus]
MTSLTKLKVGSKKIIYFMSEIRVLTQSVNARKNGVRYSNFGKYRPAYLTFKLAQKKKAPLL